MNPEEQFVEAAVRRLYYWIGGIALVLTIGVLLWKGPWYGGGFAAGAALSLLNFHWLKTTVNAIAGRYEAAVTGAEVPAAPLPSRRLKRSAVVTRFLLRYALIAIVGYVIFRSSVLSLTAFLAGLFVFVAGILAEMVYELATGASPGY